MDWKLAHRYISTGIFSKFLPILLGNTVFLSLKLCYLCENQVRNYKKDNALNYGREHIYPG